MTQYAVTFAMEADSLDDARTQVDKWQTSGDARVTLIMGPPETWTPEPEVPPGLGPEAPPPRNVDLPAEIRSEADSDDEPTP